MKPRFAKKVVTRVKSGEVTATSYSRQTVVAAFAQQEEDLPAHLMKPWDEAEAERQRRREANEARLAALKALQEEDREIEQAAMTREVEYSSMKVVELRALARERGVRGFSKMKKAELVDALM